MNKTKLLWDENGRVGCTLPGHAPYPGSDTWCSGRWREMTLNERMDFSAEIGRPVSCETCDAEKRKGVAS